MQAQFIDSSWKSWSADRKAQLWDFLSTYLTPNRQARLAEVLAYRTRHITMAIEDVYQERNAGALLRSCDCFGIQEAHIIEDQHNFRVSEVISKGAQKWVDVSIYGEEGDNTQRCVNNLRERGYRIIAATPHEDDRLVEDLDISTPLALFMGAEKRGISDTLKQEADGFVKIGMVGFTESFNVSVAAAIILHQLTLKLRNSDIAWQLTPAEKADLQIEWALRSVSKPTALMASFMSDHNS